MDFDSTLIINTLLIEPYNYISSMTDNMMVSIQDNTSKTYEIINDTIETLETMIPIFFKFAKLEDKLEKFHTN